MTAFEVVKSTQIAFLVCAGQKASAESASGDQCRQEHVCTGAGCASSAGQGLPGNNSHAQVMTDVDALYMSACGTVCDAGVLILFCIMVCGHVCVCEFAFGHMCFCVCISACIMLAHCILGVAATEAMRYLPIHMQTVVLSSSLKP